MFNPLEHKDILFTIFQFLPAESLCNAAKTCKRWNNVYRSNKFSYRFIHGKNINNNKLSLIKNLNVEKTVDLNSSKLNDNGILELCKSNKIKKIKLFDNLGITNITDQSILALSSTVEELYLFRCDRITNIGLHSLGESKKLKKLHIIVNYYITDEGFINLNFLEELCLNADKLTNKVVEYIANKNLKILSLPDQIDSLKSLSFCKLTFLDLSHSKILDEELKYIQTENLKKILLTWCENITDAGIYNLTKGKSLHLEKLGLRNTQVTDVSLMYISATDLDIWGTNITDEGFLYLDKTRRLSIGEMKNISEKCLQYLSHITYLLAPRTTIPYDNLRDFQLENKHINFNPNLVEEGKIKRM